MRLYRGHGNVFAVLCQNRMKCKASLYEALSGGHTATELINRAAKWVVLKASPKLIMRFFYDTEFIDNGETVDLISIGVVSEDGGVYYAQNADCDLSKANKWVRENVFPQLKMPFAMCSVSQEKIADDLRFFFGEDEIELWGYCTAYDHFILVKLFKGFDNVPKNFPYYTNDIAQLAHQLGNPSLPNTNKNVHNALSDALWNVEAWRYLTYLS